MPEAIIRIPPRPHVKRQAHVFGPRQAIPLSIRRADLVTLLAVTPEEFNPHICFQRHVSLPALPPEEKGMPLEAEEIRACFCDAFETLSDAELTALRSHLQSVTEVNVNQFCHHKLLRSFSALMQSHAEEVASEEKSPPLIFSQLLDSAMPAMLETMRDNGCLIAADETANRSCFLAVPGDVLVMNAFVTFSEHPGFPTLNLQYKVRLDSQEPQS